MLHFPTIYISQLEIPIKPFSHFIIIIHFFKSGVVGLDILNSYCCYYRGVDVGFLDFFWFIDRFFFFKDDRLLGGGRIANAQRAKVTC